MTTRNRTFLTLAVVAMACFALTTSANADIFNAPYDLSNELADPAITAASPSHTGDGTTYSAGYQPSNVFNNLFATNNEWGAAINGPAWLNFDFGTATAIGGFKYKQRANPVTTAFKLIFDDSADFLSPIQVITFATTPGADFLVSGSSRGETDVAFASAVTARYVRYEATAHGIYPGADEMAFTVPEPATMCLLALGGLGMLMGRRRHRV